MLASAKSYGVLAAKDFDRAKEFYKDKLDLKPSFEMEGMAMYDCAGGTKFMLYPSTYAGTNQATALCWDVEDVEKEVSELKAKGVVFEEYDMPGLKTENSIASTGDEKVAWFKDSEGNILCLSQS